ncbi:dipeptidase [Zunongwangia atlantica]|uniref:Membrane dipeptidase n=1 Tax=Zunongwangia atlantica 22II14-10F7 TaxID=1185767 RepID=A0A1Y1T6A9_9FLAO|nr:membrane dipeptidase [Zunongwangia atlantica]ORL46589.1 membrane dipeptidase [Zunongwangia atlantica 22II14-10F7]
MKIKQLGLFALLFAQAGFAQDTNEKLMAKAKKIHEKVITIDTHNDINVNNFTHDHNYTEDLDTQVNLPKMDEGDLDVSWLIVYTGQGDLDAEGYKKAYDNAISKFEAIHRLTEEIAPDEIGLATTSKEVRKLVVQGKKVAMIGVENGYPIGTDIKNVEKFYDMGARYMSLAHNGHSQLSDSNTGEADDEWLNNGLSDLGKEVIKEMNRLGIMIDVSHPSKEAIKQMFELSKAPLIASHSSARALCDHSRNLDDELLALFDKHGGVIQTVAFSSYVNTEKHEAFNTAKTEVYESKAKDMGFEMLSWGEVRELDETEREKYIENYRKVIADSDKEIEALKETVSPVDVSDFVDHIDYLVEKVGIDQVGISSDFDGGGGIDGWNDASESFNVTLELVKRGYTEKEIAKLWGENLLRVLDEVEAVAKDIQKA